MRRHRADAVAKGGRPQWLEDAHQEVRRALRLFGHGLQSITTREEKSGSGSVKSLVAEGRLDLPIPPVLADHLKAVFIKVNVAGDVQDRVVENIHNDADGQYMVKVDFTTRTCEVGLAKSDLNGLTLLEYYDDFLSSEGFHKVSSLEFVARATGLGVVTAPA